MKNFLNFLLSLSINLVLNFWGIVLVVILTGLHFWIGLPIWIAGVVALIWIGKVVIHMLIIRAANKVSSVPEPKKENKNPYSVGKR